MNPQTNVVPLVEEFTSGIDNFTEGLLKNVSIKQELGQDKENYFPSNSLGDCFHKDLEEKFFKKIKQSSPFSHNNTIDYVIQEGKAKAAQQRGGVVTKSRKTGSFILKDTVVLLSGDLLCDSGFENGTLFDGILSGYSPFISRSILKETIELHLLADFCSECKKLLYTMDWNFYETKNPIRVEKINGMSVTSVMSVMGVSSFIHSLQLPSVTKEVKISDIKAQAEYLRAFLAQDRKAGLSAEGISPELGGLMNSSFL